MTSTIVYSSYTPTVTSIFPCLDYIIKPKEPTPPDSDVSKLINALLAPKNTYYAYSAVNYPNTFIIDETPYYVSGNYTDLDHDEDVIHTVVKYFYHKIIDDWLKVGSFVDLLGYFVIDDGKVRLIKDIKDKSTTADTGYETEQKLLYIKEKILNKKQVKKWLERFVEKRNTHWYKLQNHASDVKDYLRKKLEELIMKEILI